MLIPIRVATLAIALSFMTAAVCFAANPHIGTWKFNDAKSKIRPGVTRNSTLIYSEQGDKIKATADATDEGGKPIRWIWVGKFDGKAYPVKGNPHHNAASYRIINDHTAFVQGFKDGKLMWWGTITISKDGKTRTAILQSTDAKGKKFTVQKVYDRA